MKFVLAAVVCVLFLGLSAVNAGHVYRSKSVAVGRAGVNRAKAGCAGVGKAYRSTVKARHVRSSGCPNGVCP